MEHARPLSDSYTSAQGMPHAVRVGDEPLDLLLRAYDALDQGILVVSKEGRIIHYNSAYAQLRDIGVDAALGQPLETIDRRHSIQAFLQTGKNGDVSHGIEAVGGEIIGENAAMPFDHGRVVAVV